MEFYEAQLLYRSPTPELRFLPEGPMPVAEDRISWVAIQHGANATNGSIQILNVDGSHQQIDLPERPGFAFPVEGGAAFIVGVAGRVQRLDVATGALEPLSDEIEADEPGTIINDGLLYNGGVIFGSKHLQFSDQIAGLYLWKEGGSAVAKLRDLQICSNGKELRRFDGQDYLLDIDTPTFQIVEFSIDLEQASLGRGRLVVDLESENLYPDGLVLTPDEKSLIVALYNPSPANGAPGEVRQYSLAGQNQLEAVWRIPGAPQVTCPQFVRWKGKVQLLITTAVEHMDAATLEMHPQSGGIFIAETAFERLRPAFSPVV